MTQQDVPLAPGIDVSRETYERLRALESLVQKWSPKINLVARASLPDLWQRHILDSAQLLPLAPASAAHWVDLGSGAGFPGLVIAILRHADEGKSHTLIESDQRKSAFLKTCVRELSLTARVEIARIEDVSPLAANIVSARALAPLPRLLPLVHRHLAAGGCALLPKGQSAQSEIDDARKSWHFDLDVVQSQTNPTAQILRLERIARA